MPTSLDELKKITYELTQDHRAPAAGEYLVTIGKRGVNSVYLIKTVRAVQHRDPSAGQQHYVLGVVAAQEAKPVTVYDEETYEVWVQGDDAHPLFWTPRGKSVS